MTRKTVNSPGAPKAVGPYSHAVIASGDLVFCSGQIPIVPETGELVTGPIREQTRQVFKNIRSVLESAGTSLDRVVKVTVFLRNMEDFAEMNEEYAKWFPKDPPARSAVQVARLPKDAGIEIEVVALK